MFDCWAVKSHANKVRIILILREPEFVLAVTLVIQTPRSTEPQRSREGTYGKHKVTQRRIVHVYENGMP